MKLGIIGCGYWGPNLIRNFNNISGVEMTHCGDLDESRLNHIKGIYPKTIVTKDYREILSKKDVDAIIVATPIDTHYKIAKDALNADKHVLVEKPITNSYEDATNLIKISEKNKKVLTTTMVSARIFYCPLW